MCLVNSTNSNKISNEIPVSIFRDDVSEPDIAPQTRQERYRRLSQRHHSGSSAGSRNSYSKCMGYSCKHRIVSRKSVAEGRVQDLVHENGDDFDSISILFSTGEEFFYLQ